MVESVFEDVHAKRLESLANYVVGTMQSTRVAIHAIGAAYAEVAEIKPKHGIKQVDRFLSNHGIDVEARGNLASQLTGWPGGRDGAGIAE